VSDSARSQRPGTSVPGTPSSVDVPVVPVLRKAGLFGASRMDAVNAEREDAGASIDRRLGVQRKATEASGAASIPKGSGQALPTDVRGKMEPRLGANLSGVRVHTAGDSAQAAGDLGARAFTVGSDVHFNSGEFAPGTKEGDRLLAHELTHVVQGQKAGIQRKADEGAGEQGGAAAHGDDRTAGGHEVSQPHEPAEQEADQTADAVTADLHDGEQKDGNAGKKSKGKNGKKEKKDAAPGDAAAGGEDDQHDHGGEHGAGAAHGQQQGDGKPAAGTPSATPTAPIGRKVVLPKRLPITAAPPTIGRQIFRAAAAAAAAKTPAAGTNPHAGKLKGDPVAFVKQACAGDKIAMQKIQDVEGERDIQDVAPKTASGAFFKMIADNINNEANLDVKHAYSTAGFQQAAAPYLKMGHKIDKSKITGLCSRTVRIENWWKFNCNQAQFLKQADQVTKGKVKGKEREDLAYSLMKLELSENPGAALGTLDRSKPIQPSGMHGWFTDDKVKLEPGKDAGFSQLLHVFALQPEVFAEGTVFIEIAPKGLEGDVRKPTAYDGMQSSLWVPRPGDTFGVTGGGLREFLADSIKGSAVQTANARVPNSGLAAEIKKYNDDTKGATGSASATDASVRGEKGAKSGGKGKATTDSVVATTQHEREHPSPARGPRK
jgi:hypothetical protein